MKLTHNNVYSYVRPPVCCIFETGRNISMKFDVSDMPSLMLDGYEC